MSESWFPKSTGRGLRVANADDGALELEIYDVIGGGWMGGVSAKDVKNALKGKRPSTIRVAIHSPGGDAFDGVAIYNQLKNRKARVEVSVDGLAASAASIVAMAGDSIVMASGAMMMIHEAWGMALGTSDELDSAAAMLSKVNASLQQIYAERTGREVDTIAEWMADTTWFTAEEAVDEGFATGMDSAPVRAAACVRFAGPQAYGIDPDQTPSEAMEFFRAQETDNETVTEPKGNTMAEKQTKPKKDAPEKDESVDVEAIRAEARAEARKEVAQAAEAFSDAPETVKAMLAGSIEPGAAEAAALAEIRTQRDGYRKALTDAEARLAAIAASGLDVDGFEPSDDQVEASKKDVEQNAEANQAAATEQKGRAFDAKLKEAIDGGMSHSAALRKLGEADPEGLAAWNRLTD